jgi:hypothetical protein
MASEADTHRRYRFVLDRDGTVGRVVIDEQHRQAACPDVLWPSGEWNPYPPLDLIHDCRPITKAEAQELAGPNVDLLAPPRRDTE